MATPEANVSKYLLKKDCHQKAESSNGAGSRERETRGRNDGYVCRDAGRLANQVATSIQDATGEGVQNGNLKL
jgi:hypothetical protein